MLITNRLLHRPPSNSNKVTSDDKKLKYKCSLSNTYAQHSPQIGGAAQGTERDYEEHCPDDDEGEESHEEDDDEWDADASGAHVQDLPPRVCHVVYHVLQNKNNYLMMIWPAVYEMEVHLLVTEFLFDSRFLHFNSLGLWRPLLNESTDLVLYRLLMMIWLVILLTDRTAYSTQTDRETDRQTILTVIRSPWFSHCALMKLISDR